LQAGYEELRSEAKRLEREFAHLDAQSLRYALLCISPTPSEGTSWSPHDPKESLLEF